MHNAFLGFNRFKCKWIKILELSKTDERRVCFTYQYQIIKCIFIKLYMNKKGVVMDAYVIHLSAASRRVAIERWILRYTNRISLCLMIVYGEKYYTEKCKISCWPLTLLKLTQKLFDKPKHSDHSLLPYICICPWIHKCSLGNFSYLLHSLVDWFVISYVNLKLN